MLRASRVSGLLDVGRLGAALARPGIDTRISSSRAYANAESYYDEKAGVFVDVTLVPSGQEVTARVPSLYAGVGFGFYARIHADDELLVVLPNGDPAEGAIVVARLWSEADTPPTEAKDDPDEIMLVVEKDKHLRLKTTGEGKVAIQSEKEIKLDLGGPVLTMTKDSIDVNANGKPVNIYGDNIVLNGGSAKVSRVGDKTSGHDHSVTYSLTAPSGGGPVTGTITVMSNTDTMAEGADKVKA